MGERRRALGVRPTYHAVDTCAAEFAALTPYYYAGFEEEGELARDDRAVDRRARLGPEPDRPGDRVRLLLRPRRRDGPRPRLRVGDGQLQPGDGLDRPRGQRPPLPRAGDHRRRPRHLRGREAGRGHRPARRPDAAAPGARPRRGRRAACSAPPRPRSTWPRTAARFGAAARPARPAGAAVGGGERGGRGARRRRARRLPRADPTLLRARRPRDGDLRLAGGGARPTSRASARRACCWSTASWRTRSSSTWTPSRTGPTAGRPP